MTTATFRRIGEIEINASGKVITVSIAALAFDADLREVVGHAISNPGVAVPVPNTARVPRPRNSRVWGMSL